MNARYVWRRTALARPAYPPSSSPWRWSPARPLDATVGTAAETAAGRAPIEGYDEMNVRQIVERLDGLADSDLMALRDYERRN